MNYNAPELTFVGFSRSLSSLDSLIGDFTVKRIHAQCIGIKKVRTKYKLREVMIPKRYGVNKTSTKSYKSQKESRLTSDTL